jgi:DNA replication protein DnaC
MLEDNYTSNNHAHLLLYGGAGTGKTLLVSAISSSIDTYKYLTESRFQNPDLLKSSLLSLEEFKTLDLPASQYKQLLDLKSHMKIDFKNLNPENVTAGVPCMITTNDDVFTVLRSQKKYN